MLRRSTRSNKGTTIKYLDFTEGEEFDDHHKAIASRSQYNLRRSNLVNQDSLSNVYRINDLHKFLMLPAFQE